MREIIAPANRLLPTFVPAAHAIDREEAAAAIYAAALQIGELSLYAEELVGWAPGFDCPDPEDALAFDAISELASRVRALAMRNNREAMGQAFDLLERSPKHATAHRSVS